MTKELQEWQSFLLKLSLMNKWVLWSAAKFLTQVLRSEDAASPKNSTQKVLSRARPYISHSRLSSWSMIYGRDSNPWQERTENTISLWFQTEITTVLSSFGRQASDTSIVNRSYFDPLRAMMKFFFIYYSSDESYHHLDLHLLLLLLRTSTCYCFIFPVQFKLWVLKSDNFENKYIEMIWKLKNYLHLPLSTISLRPKKHNHVKYREQKYYIC